MTIPTEKESVDSQEIIEGYLAEKKTPTDHDLLASFGTLNLLSSLARRNPLPSACGDVSLPERVRFVVRYGTSPLHVSQFLILSEHSYDTVVLTVGADLNPRIGKRMTKSVCHDETTKTEAGEATVD